MKINILFKAMIFRMPWSRIRFTFDNNFLFNYIKISDKKKKKFIKLIKRGKLIFYLTDVLIGEILHLVGKDEERLKEHSRIINEMVPVNILKDFVHIIADELNVNHDNKYYSSAICADMKKMFSNLAVSGYPSKERAVKIYNYLTENKEYEDNWKSLEETNLTDVRKEIRKKRSGQKSFKQHLRDFFNCGFDHYYRLKNEKKIVYSCNFLRTNGIVVDSEKVKRAVDDSNYPYLNSWLRCEFALHYKYIRDNHTQIDVNDLRDVRYLYYISDLDYLISSDKRISRIGKMVYRRNKVITIDEFFSMV